MNRIKALLGSVWETTTKVVFQSHFREYTILSMVMVDIKRPSP
jgi:hypothetical protein